VNPLRPGLSADNFGEWLAALGLLRVATSLDPSATLAFSGTGEALIGTTASESELAERLVASASPDAIRLEYLLETSAPGPASVRVGDACFNTATHLLSQHTKSFDGSGDSKKGCSVDLLALDGLRVRHFCGAVRSEEAGMESPLILWAGQVTFQGILRASCAKVSGMKIAPLAEMFAAIGRETQRFRFDHADEQFVDDGAHDSSAGRLSRPLVEWAAFVGLSFFPAVAGFESLSPMRRHVVSRTWNSPIDADAALLALHSGQAHIRRFFFAAPDGKMKKLRSITPPDQSQS
jgi:hypothetical protein